MRLIFPYKYPLLLLLCLLSFAWTCQASADGKFYSIHIKTVHSAELAEKITAELSQKGYDAFYRHMPSFEKGIQYRIFVGAYPSKEQAIHTINQLWNSDISDWYAIAVLREKPPPPDNIHRPIEPGVAIKPMPDQQITAHKPARIPADPDPEAAANGEESNIIIDFFNDAIRYYHEKQFEKARALFMRISEKIDNRDILFWTAICESKVGNYQQAAEKMTLFLAKEPNTPQGMLELAAILLKQKNDLKALDELEKAKAFQPPSEMLQQISRMKRLLLEDENRFSASLNSLIKKKDAHHLSENSDSAYRRPKPPREFYQIGSHSEKLLRSAQKMDPDNPAVAYYLGYIHLRNNQLADGIREWGKYLLHSPENERTIHLKKQMTLLLFRHAAIDSMSALKNDPKKPHAMQARSIALSEFRNRCFSFFPGMGKGLSAMLMDDLRKIDDIRVIDRILIHTTCRLMQPDLISISDPDSAARLGRHLSSRFIVWGEFTDISENAFQFTATITDSHHPQDSGTTDIKGTQEEFHILEKRMVYWILESIGIHKKDLSPEIILSIEKPHTRHFDAFLSYANGLEFLDKQQFTQAAMAFQGAVRIDPTFALAENAFHATPNDIYFCPFFEQSEILATQDREEQAE
ncbi:MAG: tetratricopeptide repeat protein [Pseudomonadota bacterium]